MDNSRAAKCVRRKIIQHSRKTCAKVGLGGRETGGAREGEGEEYRQRVRRRTEVGRGEVEGGRGTLRGREEVMVVRG